MHLHDVIMTVAVVWTHQPRCTVWLPGNWFIIREVICSINIPKYQWQESTQNTSTNTKTTKDLMTCLHRLYHPLNKVWNSVFTHICFMGSSNFLRSRPTKQCLIIFMNVTVSADSLHYCSVSLVFRQKTKSPPFPAWFVLSIAVLKLCLASSKQV